MNDKIQERYEKGYIRDDQLQKYVELGVVNVDEYLELTGDEEYTGEYPYPVAKPYIDTSKLRYFNYFAAGESGGKNILITDEELDNIDTSNGIDFERMFYARTTTEEIPWIDTSKGTNFSGMFRSCNALKEIPAIDTSNGTNFNSMFRSCLKITSIPDTIDTSNGTDLGEMFANAQAIESIPNLNTSKNTNFREFFFQTHGIKSIPAFDTSNGVDFYRFLFNSPINHNGDNEEGILTFDVSNGEDFNQAFASMKHVKHIVFTNEGGTNKGTNFNSTFDSCSNLESVSGLDFTNSENNLKTFSNCTKLKDINLIEGTYIHRSIYLYTSLMSIEKNEDGVWIDKSSETIETIKNTIEKIIGEYLADEPKDEENIIYLNYETIMNLYRGTDDGTVTSSTAYQPGVVTFEDETLNNLMKSKPNWKFYIRKATDSRYNRDITPIVE